MSSPFIATYQVSPMIFIGHDTVGPDLAELLERQQELLKWSIYSRNYAWESLGISDLGDILVAWLTDTVLLTANFAGEGVVRWTARIKSKTGIEHAAGSCSLQYFDKQAQFYMQQ